MTIRYRGAPNKAGTYTLECVDDDGRKFNLNLTIAGAGIRYRGTPTAPGNHVLKCVDGDGRPFDLHVKIIGSAGSDEDNCRLIRYDKDGGQYVLPLPSIQSIEDEITSSLTEISTIIYGFDDNFVMDLGTTQRYTVTLRRVQPANAINAVLPESYKAIDWSQSHDWSNGTWLRALEAFIDGWQNLNWGMIDTDGDGTKEKVRSGGFRLQFWPPKERLRGYSDIYRDLYPEIDCMGFIAGTISPRFSGNNLQYLDVTIPLTVASMVRTAQNSGKGRVTYDSGIGLGTFTHRLPQNMLDTVPSPPIRWAMQSNKFFIYWRGSDGHTYRIGDKAESGLTLTAVWEDATHVEAYLEPPQSGEGPYIFELPSSGYKFIQAWVVGGGGPGARGTLMDFGNNGGGGGGSGDFVITNLHIPDAVSKLAIYPGKGGYSEVVPGLAGTVRTYNGSESYVAIVSDDKVGTVLVRAGGGQTGYFKTGGAAGGPNGARGDDAIDDSVGGKLAEFGSGGIIPALASEVVLSGSDGTSASLHCTNGTGKLAKCGGGGTGVPDDGLSSEQGGAGGDGAVVLLFFGGDE